MNRNAYNFTLPKVLALAGTCLTAAAIVYIAIQDPSTSQTIEQAGIIGLLGAAGTALGESYIHKEESLEQRTNQTEKK